MGNPENADYSACWPPLNPVGSQKVAHLSLERASTSPGLEDATEASPSEEGLPQFLSGCQVNY